MQNFKLELLPLPTEALKLIREKFTGYLAVHQDTKSYYIWFKKGDFIGAYPEGFDLLDRLVELKTFSEGKANTIKASKKKDETIATLLTRLDLTSEEYSIKEILKIIFEEQIALAAEVFTYTSGNASVLETDENILPQDTLTDCSLGGLEFFLKVMREGEKKLAISYKELAPASVYSLKKLNPEDGAEIIPLLDPKEKTILNLADGTRSIKEIAQKCNVRSQKIKQIYIRLHLLRLLDTGVSADLKDKLMSNIGYSKVDNNLNIANNSLKAWWGAGALGLFLLFLNIAGLFQGLELSLFDRFSRWKKLTFEPNSDITLVTFDDVDIKNMGYWPMNDGDLVRVFQNLAEHEPTVIGSDIIRDLPVAPGTVELNQFYLDYDDLVSVKKVVPPQIDPPDIPATRGNVAFIDIVQDPDGVVRKFLINTWSGEREHNSFGLETALRHLEKTDGSIVYPGNDSNQKPIESKETIAPQPLAWWSSGYRWSDLAGSQILGNFVYDLEDFSTISLTDVYRGKFDPELVKGKMILIGSTADSLKDYFITPLSHRTWGSKPMAGVVVHANVASTFILGAKGELAPLKPLHIVGEFGLFTLAYFLGVGGGMVILWYGYEKFSLPSWLINAIVYLGAIVVLIGTGFWLFTGGLWIPVFSIGIFYSGGLLYSGTQLQNYTKGVLYTNRKTKIKNRKYLLSYLDSKPKGIEDYSLISLYLGFEELELNNKEKTSILKKIERTLAKHLPVKCEIVQVSENCLVLVLDSVSSDKIQSTCDRLDKILLELNISDSQNRLKHQINSITNVSLPEAEPETVLAALLRTLGS